MPDDTFCARPALRVRAALLVALALTPVPASAWPEDRGTAPARSRQPRHARASAPPGPPPAIVSGYLPRNNNVPMYNEPPPRGPQW